MQTACDIAQRCYPSYSITPNEVLNLYNIILEKRYVANDKIHAYSLLEQYLMIKKRPKSSYNSLSYKL